MLLPFRCSIDKETTDSENGFGKLIELTVLQLIICASTVCRGDEYSSQGKTLESTKYTLWL